MLKKLFRPKWENNNESTRLEGISEIPDHDTDTLKHLALNDPSQKVREAALGRIESLELLLNISKQDKTLEAMALKCWASLISSGTTMPLHEAESFVIDCKDTRQLSAIIAYSNNESLKNLAIASLTDETSIIQAIQQVHQPKLWQALIEKLKSEESLHQVKSIVRGKDKKSNQLIKEKLQELKRISDKKHSINTDINELIKKLENLANQEHDPLLEGRLINSRQKYDSVREYLDHEQDKKLKKLISEIEGKLESSKEPSSPIDSHPTREPHENDLQFTQESLDKALTCILETYKETIDFNKLPKEVQLDIESIISIRTRIKESTKQLSETLDKLEALTLDECKSLKNKARQLFKECKATTSNISLTPEYKCLEQQYSRVSEYEKDQLKIEKNIQLSIKKLIKDADEAIDKDNLKKASGLIKTINQQSKQLSRESRSHLQPAIHRLNQATKTLEDWKEYATDPKRDELIEQMQLLIIEHLPVNERALKIKNLQDQWKQLGYCHNKDQWQAFQSAGDKAYEPCKQLNEEKRQEKQFNLEQKKVIYDQLENLVSNVDWENCDWHQLEKIVSAIENEWKKYSPIEHESHKAMQPLYLNKISELKKPLNAYKKSNKQKLEDIIKAAEKLHDTDNLNAAIENYQQLHEQWKNVGLVFHKDQRTLWKAFKDAGQKLYDQRDSLRKEADADREANLQKTTILINQVNDIIHQCENNNFSELGQAFELVSKIKSIGSIPKNKQKTIRQDVQLLENKLKEYQSKHKRSRFIKTFEPLEKIASEIAELECQGEHPELQNIESLNESWQAYLEQRMLLLKDENLEKLARQACVKLEILCDVDSPEDDKQLRMEIQMELLKDSFGQMNKASTEAEFEKLYTQWFAIPCWNQAEHAKLHERVMKCKLKFQSNTL